MRLVHVALILALASSNLLSQETKPDEAKKAVKAQKIAVKGKLSRAMGIGGESTGWMIELDSETTIDGKPMHSIEIAYPKAEELDKLVDKRVKAKGTVGHRHGVETGDRTVLEVKKIKAAKAN